MSAISEAINTLSSIDWTALWAIICTIGGAIGTIFGAIKAKFAKKETKRADEAEDAIAKINAFFNPENDVIVEAPIELHTVAYTMSDTVMAFLKQGLNAYEQTLVETTVKAQQAAGVANYVITTPSGFWARIDYGQVTASGTPGSEAARDKMITEQNLEHVTIDENTNLQTNKKE